MTSSWFWLPVVRMDLGALSPRIQAGLVHTCRRAGVWAGASRVPGPHRGARPRNTEEARMTSSTETGGVTGTPDKDYNLIWYVEACLSNALRLETYIADAERDKDAEIVDLFRKSQADSRKGAELGKR